MGLNWQMAVIEGAVIEGFYCIEMNLLDFIYFKQVVLSFGFTFHLPRNMYKKDVKCVPLYKNVPY